MTTASQPETEKKSFLYRIFHRPEKKYADPYLGGILLGLVLFASLFITGSGLGASGGYSRYVAFIEDIIAPGHIDQVPYLIHIAGGELNPLDNWIVMVTTGVLLGGFVSGLVHGRAKVELHKGPSISSRTRLIMAFLGGTIFTFGARMARGCTSGQALSGGAVLSAGSWTIAFAIFASAYALAYFVRKLWL